MAETLTFENNVETTTLENLNADEQDSLRVGEEMQEAQDSLLAGKYKDAQELEKAYVELEKKLGDNSDKTETEPEAEAEAETTDKEEKKDDAPESNILDDLWEQTLDDQKYSDETLEALSKMSASDLAKMHIEYRANNQQQKSSDLSDKDVEQLKSIAGGDDGYKDMMSWATSNLNKQEIDMFDAVMERGDPLAAFFAVRSLAYRWEDAKGYDGKMLTGTAPKTNGSTFRSQAEVVEAMGDPRYDNDPAYRQDVMEKLQRSDINF